MHRSPTGRAWLISGGIAVGFWFLAALANTLALATVPGFILLGWGAAVAANWRGAPDAMPTTSGLGPFRQTVSTPMIQLIFGGFVLFGVLFLAVGIAHL